MVLSLTGIVCGEGEDFVDIPFSVRIPNKKEALSEVDHQWMTFKNAKQTEHGNTLTITTGSGTFAEHLVLDHDIPEWVAELYINDPVSLVRMHEGTSAKAARDSNQKHADELLQWSQLKTKAFSGGYLDASEIAEQKKHFLSSREYWVDKVKDDEKLFRMLRVRRPKTKE